MPDDRIPGCSAGSGSVPRAFVGLTSLAGAFADGGDVWQRLLVVLLHPLEPRECCC